LYFEPGLRRGLARRGSLRRGIVSRGWNGGCDGCSQRTRACTSRRGRASERAAPQPR